MFNLTQVVDQEFKHSIPHGAKKTKIKIKLESYDLLSFCLLCLRSKRHITSLQGALLSELSAFLKSIPYVHTSLSQNYYLNLQENSHQGVVPELKPSISASISSRFIIIPASPVVLSVSPAVASPLLTGIHYTSTSWKLKPLRYFQHSALFSCTASYSVLHLNVCWQQFSTHTNIKGTR